MLERYSYISLVAVAAVLLIAAGSRQAVADKRLLESFGDAENAQVDFTRPVRSGQVACGSLREIATLDYSIISAQPGTGAESLPPHCEIHGVIAPEVQFWLFLPRDWNGRFYMLGNGEFAGGPPFSQPYKAKIDNAIRHNFAVAFTDTGHDAAYEPGAEFGYREIQKTVDYGFRAIHVTALAGKAIIEAYYESKPSYSYFDGCSTGGRQGLMEAQRYPSDFDGILAGAPVNNFVNQQIWKVWVYQELQHTPIPPEKVDTILAPAILAQCDGLDGLEDGLIQDPRICRFRPEEHLPVCGAGADGATCFSSEEIRVLERIYSPVMSRGGVFFPGLQLGTEPRGVHNLDPRHPVETGWTIYLIDENGAPGAMSHNANEIFRYLVFDDPDYHWREFDFDKDPYRSEIVAARRLFDATETDLGAFKAQGGKIVSYHGWADSGPPGAFTVEYYENLMADMGTEAVKEFYRLYMVPGMFHCGGGYGTDFFDAMTPLIDWVEAGVEPGRILAKQREGGDPDGRVMRTRPLCIFPQYAHYGGDGDPDNAESFTCLAPPD